jgi:hypothetical protein
MKLANFTLDQLKVLPLRAIVAFASRCARRVEPLALLPEGDPKRENRRAAVDAALRMAEEFARGTDAAPDESVIALIDATRDEAGESAGSNAVSAAAQAAHAAASCWHAGFEASEEDRELRKHSTHAGPSSNVLQHVTADLAAFNAYSAAAGAFLSVGFNNEDFIGSAMRDYDILVRLQLGRYPEPGVPVDPSPSGPLGPL